MQKCCAIFQGRRLSSRVEQKALTLPYTFLACDMSKVDVLPPGAIRVSTLLGEMLLASDGHALVFATFVDTFPHDLSSVSAGPGGGCLGNFFQEVSYQIDNYLHGRQRKFTVPVCPRGSHFSQRVLECADEDPTRLVDNLWSSSRRPGLPEICSCCWCSLPKKPNSYFCSLSSRPKQEPAACRLHRWFMPKGTASLP